MAQRWIIHSRDRTLGPWTSAQVRDELRAGRIDPFDMVSQENSLIKRPLVEVDDIFQSSRVQMAEIVSDTPETLPLEVNKIQDATMVSQQPAPLAAAGAEASTPQVGRPRQFQALAAEARLAPATPQKKPGAKNYIVTDSTGRSLGPMSSQDVMDIWRRGMVDARAIIQRKDQPRKISIQKFASFYERAAPSGIAFLTEDGQSNPSFRYSVKSSGQGLLAWFVLIVALVALGFLGHTVYQSQQRIHSRQQKMRVKTPANRFDLKANEDLAGRIAPVKRKDALPPPSNSKPVLSEKVDVPSGVSSESAQATVRETVQRTAAPKAPKAPKLSRPVNRTSRRGTDRVSPPRASQAPSRAPPRRVVRTSPVTAPKRVSLSKPIPSVQLEDGKNVTLSGYRFSASALSSCDGKCKIPMSGSAGPVTAIFFKEAHGSAFAGRAGGVSVSGIIRKSPAGWQIIVSNVK